MQLVYIALIGLSGAVAVGLVGGLVLKIKERRMHSHEMQVCVTGSARIDR